MLTASRAFLFGLALWLAAAPFAHAQTGSQKTVSQINAEIGTSNTGLIQDFNSTNPGFDIPFSLRQILLDIAASFLNLNSTTSVGVASIGGLSGTVSLGPGLGSVSPTIVNTGVIGLGGVTGPVSVTAPLGMLGQSLRIASPISLNLGGLGQTFTNATLGQMPTFPSSGQAAVPTDECINAQAVGANPTLADNTGAWNKIVTTIAASPGLCMYWPRGQYTFLSNISVNLAAPFLLFNTQSSTLAHITVRGDGPDLTTFYFPASNGLTVNYNSAAPGSYNQQGADIEDLTFATGSSTGLYTGLTLQQIGQNAGSAAAPTNIINVVFRGADNYAGFDYWGVGANLIGIPNAQVGRSIFQGSPVAVGGIGLEYNGITTTSTLVATVLHVYGTTFNYWNVGFQQGRYVQGVTIDGNTNFTGNVTGVFVPPFTATSVSYVNATGLLTLRFSDPAVTSANGSPALVLNCASSQLAGIWPIQSGANSTAVVVSATSGLGTLGASATAGCAIAEQYATQLQINDDQFGQFQTGNGIIVESYDSGVQISNSLFGSTSPAINTPFIDIFAASNFNIVGNTMGGGTTNGTYGVFVNNSGYSGAMGGTIANNVINGVQFGVNLTTTVSNVTVIGNRYTSDSFNVVDNGIGDQVWDNFVGVSTISLLTSPYVYTASSHPETIYVRNGTGNISNLSLGKIAASTTIATSISASAATTVQLWPNESVIFTYTGAPTVIKDVH